MLEPTTTVRPVIRRTRHPLSSRNALRGAALVTAAHAAVLLASPEIAASVFGAPAGAASMARACGLLCVGLAIVFWSAAGWPASMMQRPVLWAAAVVATGMAVMGGIALLGGEAVTLAGLVVAAEAIVAVWAGWLVVTDRV